MKFLNYKYPKIFTLFLFLIIGFSIFVRIQDLGYSNFQGDEVNTVDFIYEMKNNDVVGYLFSQKRGPTQYLINLTNVGLFGYHNEFLIRLPYVLFGILAIFSLYYLAKNLFGRNVALIAAVFISINALFIAFSRITQYQSVMYSLIPIGILLFLKALKLMSVKYMVISSLVMSFMLLTHYDTISVVPFFVVMFVGKFIREEDYSKQKILEYLKLGIIFFGLFIIPALLYYIPFSMHQEFSDRTSGYLEGRLLGGGLMPRTWITLYLLSMYKPIWFTSLIYFLAAASGFFYIKSARNFSFKFINDKLLSISLSLLVFLNIAGSILSIFYFKPRLSTLIVISTAIGIAILLTFAKKINLKYAATMTWFLAAYSAYFFLLKDPRTHVYVVFMPAFILAGYTVYKLYASAASRILKYAVLVLFAGVILFISGLNYTVFVNKNPEFPWFEKTYLGQEIFELPRLRGKKIDGVFGFNNWRGWETVAEQLNNGCLVGTFDSNEKDSITYFYIQKHQLRQDLLGYLPNVADTFIYVEGPHSWEYDLPIDTKQYDLVAVIKSNDYPVTKIYSKNYNPACFE